MTTYFAKDPTAIRLTVSAVARRGVEQGRALGRHDGNDAHEKLHDSDGPILLMQRSDNGHWGLPGGHVEPGESVTDATVREVFEETGWRIEVGRLIGVYSDPARQTVAHHAERPQMVNLCFDARVVGEAGQPTTPEETLAIGFFASNDLPTPFVPIHEIRVQDAELGRRETFVR